MVKKTVLAIMVKLMALTGVLAQNDKLPEAFFSKYEYLAVCEMYRVGIPASIKLGQAAYESGYGESFLARKANNYFGIKAFKDWEGEDCTYKGSNYRKYQSPEASFIDHSDHLLNRKNYTDLFKLDKNNYKAWAKGLQAAGYAKNTNYANRLIEIIERYNLQRFDKVALPSLKH